RRIAPASRSRRTAPCGRRAQHEARAAACARAVFLLPGLRSSSVPHGRPPGKPPGRAPSVTEPERFRRNPERAAYSVGEPCHATRRTVVFQSVIPPRPFCLSVSGAVSPSAPAWAGLSRRVRLTIAILRHGASRFNRLGHLAFLAGRLGFSAGASALG